MTPRDQPKANHPSPSKDSPSKDDSPVKTEIKVDEDKEFSINGDQDNKPKDKSADDGNKKDD